MKPELLYQTAEGRAVLAYCQKRRFFRIGLWLACLAIIGLGLLGAEYVHLHLGAISAVTTFVLVLTMVHEPEFQADDRARAWRDHMPVNTGCLINRSVFNAGQSGEQSALTGCNTERSGDQ